MLSAKWIRDNLACLKESLEKRKVQVDLDNFLSLDQKRRDIIQKCDGLKHKQNLYSKKIGALRQQKKDSQHLIEEVKDISSKIDKYELKRKSLEEKARDFLLNLPNALHSKVPAGSENIEERRWGEIPQFDFSLKDHQQIGESLEILDFKRAAKIVGRGFVVCKGLGARLERALINFMLDFHVSQGYTEILPPFMTNAAAATGTGQLPKFREELYKCERDDYYLVPTAEVPVTNLHREEILTEDTLPLSY
ncbi:unnamed protein product, partial [marine sediment metagenome]